MSTVVALFTLLLINTVNRDTPRTPPSFSPALPRGGALYRAVSISDDPLPPRPPLPPGSQPSLLVHTTPGPGSVWGKSRAVGEWQGYVREDML